MSGGRHAQRSASDIERMTPPPPAQQPAKRGMVLVIGLAVVLPLLIGLAIWNAAAGGNGGDTYSYVDEVATRLEITVPDTARDKLIAAGHELCASGITGADIGRGREARAILAAHDLGSWYADSWPYVSAAAAEHLC